MFQFLVFVLFVEFTVLSSSSDVLCPVSKNPDYARHGNLLYPVEIYGAKVSNDLHHSCIADFHRAANYSCPIKFSRCPLIMANLLDAVRDSKVWKKSTSLCSLKAAFSDTNSNCRIITFGGSVTVGSDAVGCCSRPECFTKLCKLCAWPSQLEHWLHSTTRGNISVYNLGNTGTTSDFTAEVIYTVLSNANIRPPFSSRDVFFLDHSFNDNALSEAVKVLTVENGIEKLIRIILSMAKAPNDIPHIILLETDTLVRKVQVENRYYTKYRKLAHYYGLRVYSYAEAIWSESSKSKQEAYYQYLTHNTNQDHPPWHIHLLYADLIAGLMLTEMNECGAEKTSVTDIAPPFVMPKPLSAQDSSHICKTSVYPVLKMSYKDLMDNTAIGAFNAPRNNTWALTLDKKQRGGFIIQLTSDSQKKSMGNALIKFSLNITLAQIRSAKYMLQVQYLRSYRDAGKVSLYFCDTYIWYLDALWVDYQHYRHTVQDVYTVRVQDNWCQRKHAGDPVVFTVVYRPHLGPPMAELVQEQPRGNQIFKVNSVLVCQLE